MRSVTNEVGPGQNFRNHALQASRQRSTNISNLATSLILTLGGVLAGALITFMAPDQGAVVSNDLLSDENLLMVSFFTALFGFSYGTLTVPRGRQKTASAIRETCESFREVIDYVAVPASRYGECQQEEEEMPQVERTLKDLAFGNRTEGIKKDKKTLGYIRAALEHNAKKWDGSESKQYSSGVELLFHNKRY